MTDIIDKSRELLNKGKFTVCQPDPKIILDDLSQGLAANENSIYLRATEGDIQARVNIQDNGKIEVAFIADGDGARFTITPGTEKIFVNKGKSALNADNVDSVAKSIQDHVSTQLGIDKNPNLKNAVNEKHRDMVEQSKPGNDCATDIFARVADNGQAQNLADNLDKMAQDPELIRQVLAGDEAGESLFRKLLSGQQGDFSEISDRDVKQVQENLIKLAGELREGGAVALAQFKVKHGLDVQPDSEFAKLLEQPRSIPDSQQPEPNIQQQPSTRTL